MTDAERQEAAESALGDLFAASDIDVAVLLVRTREGRVTFFHGLRNPYDIPALTDLLAKATQLITKVRKHVPGFYR